MTLTLPASVRKNFSLEACAEVNPTVKQIYSLVVPTGLAYGKEYGVGEVSPHTAGGIALSTNEYLGSTLLSRFFRLSFNEVRQLVNII